MRFKLHTFLTRNNLVKTSLLLESIGRVQGRKVSLQAKRLILEEIVRGLVNEIGYEQVVNQYKDKLDPEVFDLIDKVSKKKPALMAWLASKVLNKSVPQDQVSNFETYFDTFEKYKNKKGLFPYKDLGQYRTPEDVQNFIKIARDVVDNPSDTLKKDPNYVSHNEIQTLKDVGILYLGKTENNYQVFKVPKKLANNNEAYKAYKNILARCSDRENDGKIAICTMANISHFNNYLKNDDYYVFYNYGDPKSPYQFHYQSNQFRDKTDKSLIDLDSI